MIAETKRRSRAHFEWPILVVVYLLALFGIYCIASATYDPDRGTDQTLLSLILNSRSSMWQSIFVLVSPVVVFIVSSVPLDLIRSQTRLIYLGVTFLLVVTLLTATLVNGISAWLETGLGRSIQPAEFSKLAILLVLARELSKSEKPLGTFREFLRVGFLVAVPSLIVLMQGETGSVIVIAVMFVFMIYFSGADIRLVVGIVTAAALAITAVIAYAIVTESTDYRILRLLAFTDPTKYSSSGGYQLLNSQKAIGSGQVTGLGAFTLGTVTQLGGVPENSTDFILSTIGEAFGFVGVVGVLAAYFFIIFRMMYLARYTQDRYGRLIIVGVMGMLFFHVFENVSMCLGLMPITGIPLPFLSYGGSNFMTNIIAVALVINVTRSRTSSSGLYSVQGYTESEGVKRFLREKPRRRGLSLRNRGGAQ